ncbi:MAG: hypothetical protein KAY24_19230 [Candidatus Eisenbacteria sp.]|nr:hypothetical protein [Candidatus Eisenbacteria bacterium]
MVHSQHDSTVAKIRQPGHADAQPEQKVGEKFRLGVSLLLLGLFGLLSVAPALAQSEVDRTSVLRALEKTDQIIEKARELAAEATSIASHDHLRRAIELQRKAWQEFRRRDPTYRKVVILTLKARTEAVKALDATRIEKRTQESVHLTIERAEERAHEIGPLVRDSGNAQAMQILREGIEQLRRARRAFRDRHYAQAARLATLATSLMERAGRIARRSISAGAAAEVSIERTEALLAQVETTLAEQDRPPGDFKLRKEARRLLGQARERLQGGDPKQALRLSLAARQKALQLLTQISAAPGGRELLDVIEKLSALYAEMGPEIQSEGDEQAQRVLDEGRRLLRRARDLATDGKTRQALQHALAAQRLLRKAARLAGL